MASSAQEPSTSGSSNAYSLPTHKLASHPRARQPSKPVVLVGCGSFNPPTVMHMRMFELASDELLRLGYDPWGGYVSPVSDAYGKAGLASAQHRLAMCEAAASSCPLTMVDSWEGQQPVYTPTLQVLQRVRDQVHAWLAHGHRPPHRAGAGAASALQQGCEPAGMPGQPSGSGSPSEQQYPVPQVMLLCGADLLASLTIPGVWENPDALLADYGVACIVRDGTDVDALLQHEVLHRGRRNIIIVPEPVPNFLSSTIVRQQIAQHRSVRYLVPNGVVDYLATHPDLYQRKSHM